MADSARNLQISRRSWLLAGLAIPVFRLRAAERLAVSFDGDNLHVSGPGLHFLTGKPLTRLKDGATVVFVSQLTIYTDPYVTPYRRSAERYVISYDIWAENKFSVTIPGAVPRTVSNLSAPLTEAWCQENFAVTVSGLAPDRPFWVQFDMRTADQKDVAALLGGSGLSLSTLINLFSRRSGADDLQTWRDGPFRLKDVLRITPGRGSRG